MPCGTATFAAGRGCVAPLAGAAAESSISAPAEPTARIALARCRLAQVKGFNAVASSKVSLEFPP
jgi:hypothetical protein